MDPQSGEADAALSGHDFPKRCIIGKGSDIWVCLSSTPSEPAQTFRPEHVLRTVSQYMRFCDDRALKSRFKLPQNATKILVRIHLSTGFVSRTVAF
jgi:hypothetical protein